jgi:mono/diheme cytochrome c family protein
MVTRMAWLVAGSQFASGGFRFAASLLTLAAILSAQHALNRNPGVEGGTTAAAAAAPTFCKQAAPILFKHCAQCHQPGEIASTVSLLSYETARPWAKAIREKVLLREMPPWPPDPRESVLFRNDTRLSPEDIHTLAAWVDAGAPQGDESDLPAAPRLAQGWLHPNGVPPDAVISLPEFDVPAVGEVPYVTHLVKVPFSEDKWVTAIQVRPGNGAVVHHMAITEVRAEERFGPDAGPLAALARQVGIQNDLIRQPAVTAPGDPAVYDMLGVYTPGASFEMYEDGAAKLLKGGKNFFLNVNIHYQTIGRPEKDLSVLALWFQPQPPKHQLFRVNGAGASLLANGRELLIDAPQEKAEGNSAAIPPIPPNSGNYEVTGMTAYTEPVIIYQFHPHAHLRAKDFTYTIVYEDGREQTVLSIPKYDFHWQLAYDLKTPLALPAGSKLVVTAHYDNSVNNINNPAADKEVHFLDSGNQTWDEMFTPFIQYTIDSHDPPAPLDIVEAGGCLEQTPIGGWILTHASDPAISKTQATSSVALTADAAQPLGNRQYQLLGARFFGPGSRKAQRVAVQGVLITGPGESRINVTSLQTVAPACVK